MRWKIWGRQCGKSYDIMQWWLDNPEKRFILCGSALLADVRRHDADAALGEMVSGGWYSVLYPNAKWLIREHILSVAQWRNLRTRDSSWEIALDDAELTISQLVGGNVEIVAGQGVNEKPDPKQLERLRPFQERMRQLGFMEELEKELK